MELSVDAWVLHAGPVPEGPARPVPGAFVREPFRLPELADEEVLIEPLYGSWEANIDHALLRDPIDVCRARGEDAVILGNLAVARVLRPGRRCGELKAGDLCLVMPFGVRDRYGYAELAYAYDAPGTFGVLAKQTKLTADQLLPVPEQTRYSLPDWAAYGRYFTAWDNWRVAHGCWRTQMEDADPGSSLVFGWGGGVVFAEMQLAQQAGFTVAMTAGSDQRLAFLKEHGIIGVDRRLFPDLSPVPGASGADPRALSRQKASRKKFAEIIDELSGGGGVSIFIDNIGAPLYRSTVRALGRQGVIASVGWKGGMQISSLRATECIKRQLHVNTHVWRHGDSASIRDQMELTGWGPAIDPGAVYDFDDVPQLAADYQAGKLDTYFPLFRINEA